MQDSNSAILVALGIKLEGGAIEEGLKLKLDLKPI
jgi:hypothetical protein